MKPYRAGIFFIFLFGVAIVATLTQYGINEDSPLHFMRGQAYLQLLTSGQKAFAQPRLSPPVLFIPDQRISLYKYNSVESGTEPAHPIVNFDGSTTIQERFFTYIQTYGRQSFYKHNAWSADVYTSPGHPPVSDILEALTNRIFYETLGVLGDIEAYHVYIVITAILALLAVYYFTFQTVGPQPAFLAVVTLALYPLFFSESHFNIKDIPELSFFTVSIIAFYFWVKTRKIDWFIVLVIAFYIGVGTKLNIVFLPGIVLFWLVSLWKTDMVRKWFSLRHILYIIGGGVVVAVALYATWPFLWESPFQQFLSVVNVYAWEVTIDPRIQEKSSFLLTNGIDISPLLLVLTQTPLVSVVLFFTGLIGLIIARFWSSFRLVPHNIDVLLCLWFVVPFLRVLRPGADTLQSMRSYLEFLPALAIIAGIGGGILLTRIKGRYAAPIFYGVYLVSLLFILIRTHPNENMYFNDLAGRFGIKNNLISWRSSYENPYRQSINWLNTNAPQNAQLAYLDGTMQSIPSIWLRPDIPLGSYFSGYSRKGEYIMTNVYPRPPSVFPYLYLERFLEPVYEVKQDGIPLVRIYKNDLAHTKPSQRSIVPLPGHFVLTHETHPKLGDFWTLDLGADYDLASLTLEFPREPCNMRDGLFRLDTTFMVIGRSDLTSYSTRFDFPGTKTRKIIFYGLDTRSCFLKSSVLGIDVVK